ncbi:MAG: zinc-ribbon domain-containing protein [Ignavibacterium sp.]|jgi:hypothetical protein|nr:zinc-ribbon domain-containing protein [Ignavibacterium sp.]
MIRHSLKEKYPELIKEWHPTKNGKLTPDNVTAMSGKKVWWICLKNKDHVYPQRISYHVKSKKCPICSGKKVAKSNSLATLFPQIAKEWHPTKNGTLTPNDVTANSHVDVWWQCPINEKHAYKSRIDQRTKRNSKCPICQNKKIIYENSLEALFPNLISEWDYDKNTNINPSELGAGSSLKVWWKCKKNHSWQTRINDRTKGSNCPKCNKPVPHSLQTLDKENPELLIEWNTTKNLNIKPEDFSAGSSKKVWWICSKCGHEWQAVIANRARKQRGCPECHYKGIDKQKSLATLFPKVAAEWHPELNKPLTPNDVSYGSGRLVWWQCSKNKNHIWQAIIKNRTSATPNKCPKCLEKLERSLEEEFPDISKEWHYLKNDGLKPSDVLPQSNKKVWWICSNNPEHEWEAVIKNRTILKSGCPICYKEKSNISTVKELIDSIITSSESYTNYKKGIDSLIKLTNVKIQDSKLNRTFKKMIYANLITQMEAYLSDTFIKTVFRHSDLQRRFIETNPRYQKEKIEISNIYSWMNNIEKYIRDELIEITYHNIWKVQNMYKAVLEIDFPDNLEEVQEIIQVRHDLIHRAGKTKDGKIINITIADIKKAVDRINKFIMFIEEQFSKKRF